MENKKNSALPILRFPEFSGEWEEKRLGEICETFKSGIGITADNISSNRKYPVYGGNGLRGYTDTFTHDGIYALIGRQGALCGNVNLINGKSYISEHAIAVSGNEFTNIKWLAIRLEYMNLNRLSESSAQPGLAVNKLVKLKLLSPSFVEQTKIAEFLSAIDERLELLVEKKKMLEAYKKGVMQKLFSQALRFKDENGNEYPEWEERKLGDLTKCISNKNKNKIEFPIYSISNKNGFVPQGQQFDGIDSNERGYDISLYKIINEEMFAYNPARINVGSIGYSYDLDNIIISSLYVCFKTNDDINDSLLFQYFKSYEFNKEVKRKTEGGVREYLFYENFSKIKVSLPNLAEQQKIANFLSALDDKITAMDNKITHTQQYKKALLQQMFV